MKNYQIWAKGMARYMEIEKEKEICLERMKNLIITQKKDKKSIKKFRHYLFLYNLLSLKMNMMCIVYRLWLTCTAAIS